VKSKEAEHGEYEKERTELGPVIRSNLGRKRSSTSSMCVVDEAASSLCVISPKLNEIAQARESAIKCLTMLCSQD